MSGHRWMLQPPLLVRRGPVLKVVGVARISTEHQSEKSLEDQEALYRRWLTSNFNGEYELQMIASRGSGERLDRKELTQLAEVIESEKIDLVLTEDLGRITRRVHAAIAICEDCEDHKVRLIAINDDVDTFRDGWRLTSIFAGLRHESYNADTGKRIRRTQRNRFDAGGMLRTPLFCYTKPEGAKHDSEMSKIPEMEPIVEEMFRRLENGHPFTAIADWFNEMKIPCGRGAKRSDWIGPHVKNVIYNPILKGVRMRNRKTTHRINKTGRRKAALAPQEDHQFRQVPHLAFVEPGRYDRLVAQLKKQNEVFDVRRARGGDDPRFGRPKKRSRFPGQQVICGICNRTMVFGGNGRTSHLMCNGAREYQCWNGSTFDADLAAQRISEAVLAEIQELPEFETSIRDKIVAEAAKLVSDRDLQRQRLTQEAAKNEREVKNLLGAIKAGVDGALVREELTALEAQRRRISQDLSDVDLQQSDGFQLPTIGEIKSLASEAVKELAIDDLDFAILMRQLIAGLTAVPVRLPDGGYVETRLIFRLRLGRFVPADCRVDSILNHLTRDIVVDAFDPPERVRLLPDVIRLRQAGMSERAVAKELNTTVTAAQRAARLYRMMNDRGITDPYQPVTEPPSDLSKMKRHLHPRYRFNPLPPPEPA